MRYISLTIEGNHRLKFAMIHRIHLDFESNYQILIGTNGSGKSTILRECSMLPAITSDYASGGGKTVVAEHNGERYTASSKLRGANTWKHSLIRMSDETELNPGGTREVQKQVVEELFGLTESLFDILVGDTLFTNMSPAVRRQWILHFSGSDLEYAMTVYKNLSSKQRDLQALQRHYAQRLATELTQQIDEKEMDALAEQSHRLSDIINLLMLSRDSNLRSSDEYDQEMDILVKQVDELEEKIVERDVVLSKYFQGTVGNMNDAMLALDDMRIHRNVLKNKLSDLYLLADRMREMLNTLRNNGSSGITDLINVTETREKQVEVLKSQITHHHDQTQDVESSWGLLSGQLTAIVDTLSRIPDNSHGLFTKSQYQVEMRKWEKYTDEVTKIDQIIDELNHKIYHLSNLDTVDCPSCDHHWTPGADSDELARLHTERDQYAESRKYREEQIDKLKDYLHDYDEFMAAVKQLNIMIDKTGRLKPMWNIISQLDIYKKSAVVAIPVVHQYLDDLELSVQIHKHMGVIRNNREVIASITAMSKGQSDFSEKELSNVQSDIQNCLKEIEQLDMRMKDLSKFVEDASEMYEDADEYRRLIDKMCDTTYQYLLSIRTECINDDIREQQITLANVQSKLNQSLTGKALIDEIRRNKQEVDDDLAVINVMVEKLSPVKGLIATHIKAFFDQFIEHMNGIFDEVWTYSLRMLSTDIAMDGVNCKFPVETESAEHGAEAKVYTSDISKTSSSQTDIINFAFPIVARMCKNIDIPLYLDEVGIRMDEKHRDRFNSFVERYMEARPASQMFMVSHYVAMHGIFTQADICLLDKTNILNLPDYFNRHVTIDQAA